MSVSPKGSLHSGHRDRMRQRYLRSGIVGFQQHEILELLLFYTIPRCNTNSIAHELIDTFHSLSGVLNADVNELKQIKGIGDNSAVFLHLLPDVFRAYELSRCPDRLSFGCIDELKKYIAGTYTGKSTEEIHVLCLDSDERLISDENLGTGLSYSSASDIRIITEIAVRNRADSIVLAHNHPSGSPVPSHEDINFTKVIRDRLKLLDIHLKDHFIAGKFVLSMRECGYITD